MLQVLLADDEARDLALLKNAIDWEQHGMTVAGCAKDALELEELEERLRPDIVITDIVLPHASGLDFARMMREKRPQLHIIFISGNVSFDYAVGGMEAGVEKYIVKPVDPKELAALLDDTVARCIKEKQERFAREEFSRDFEANLPAMREAFLKSCVSGEGADEQTLQKQMEFYRVPLNPVSLCAIIVSPDERLSDICRQEYDRIFYRLEIKTTLESALEGTAHSLFPTDSAGEYALLINCTGENRQAALLELAERLISGVKQICGLSATAGIGMPVDGFSRLPMSFGCARSALSQRFYLGRGQAIFYGDVPYAVSPSYPSFEKISDELIGAALYGSGEKLDTAIGRLRARVNEYRIPSEDLRVNCVALISRAIIASNQPYLFSSASHACQKLFSLGTADEVLDFLREFLLGTGYQLRRSTRQHHANVAESVRRIINEELSGELSLDIIADRIHLSKGYVAKIFKDVTGENVNRYIVMARMREAKRLLANRDMLISDVAHAVGYQSAAYFSAAFKSEYRISPKVYRYQLGFDGEDEE